MTHEIRIAVERALQHGTVQGLDKYQLGAVTGYSPQQVYQSGLWQIQLRQAEAVQHIPPVPVERFLCRDKRRRRHVYFWETEESQVRQYGWLRDTYNRTALRTTSAIKQYGTETYGEHQDEATTLVSYMLRELAFLQPLLSQRLGNDTAAEFLVTLHGDDIRNLTEIFRQFREWVESQ